MTNERPLADGSAGIALIAAALLSVLGMAHHPTSLTAGAAIQIVHGLMIAVLTLTAFGFVRFAQALGLGRPAVLGGLIAYAIGAGAGIGAATIDGFIAPSLFDHVPAVSHDFLVLTFASNQALAALGVIATGLAYTLWSLALWRRARVIAALGVLTGLAPGLLLLTGWIDMHLHFAILVYATQALWAALVGWLLLRGARSSSHSAKEGGGSPNGNDASPSEG